MYELTRIPVQIQGRSLHVAARVKHASNKYIIFVHGWACRQDGFEEAFSYHGFDGYSVCTFDLLGHGLSDRPQDFNYSMEVHTAVTTDLVHSLAASEVHLVGHSMGGLIGLLAAEPLGGLLSSFISAEGNLIAADAGVRIRGMVKQPLPVFKAVGSRAMQMMMAASPDKNTRTWAKWWGNTKSEAIYKEAQSIIDWSDSGKLLEKFKAIKGREYIVGEKSDKDATVAVLESSEVVEVPQSGHFLMFDNPSGFYGAVAAVIKK